MLGLTSSLRARGRERAVLAAIAAIIGLAVLVPSSAHASGCTDEWKNKEKSGSWFEAANWSKGVPTSADEVCITEKGTYTVTMTQTSGTVSVKALTIGGTSGTQTLAVGSSSSVNAILTTTAGITNGAHGAITLTNGDTAGNSVTLTGPVTNAGTITTEVAHGGTRTLQGNLTNTGTLAINTETTYRGEGTLLTNEGAINVAEGKQLTVKEGASVTNGTGGKIVGTGSGAVLEVGGTFTEGAGTTSGTKPVIIDDGTLSYTGSGASTIALRGVEGKALLSGTSSSGQSLLIESTCSENAIVTAATGFTNGGTITLTNGDACADNATLVVSSGTLANGGTITTEPAIGGTRVLEGNLKNTGTLAINANTTYNLPSTLLTNEGAINIAEGKQLTAKEGASVTNGTGGKIVGTGSGDLFQSNGTFTEGAGTTTGTKPVIVDDGTLSYTGSGASTIALRGVEGKALLSGTSSSGQSLLIESTCAEHAVVTAATGFTNSGTITLTNGDACADNATLAVSSGTLANSGTITTEPAVGGTRTLQGNLTNTGTLAINTETTYRGEGTLLTNEGAINVAEGKQLTVKEGASVTNGTGGKIVGTGSGAVLEVGGTFTEGAGTTSGTKPVIIDDGTLSYTGSGASTIALRGVEGKANLSGNLASGQSLLIESTCAEHAIVTAATGFTNGGAITLTNGDACADNATLVVSSGTLANSGTITTEPLHGGKRVLEGNLTNTGTIAVNATTLYDATGATLQNNGAIDIANEVTLSAPSKPTISNEAGGAIVGTGTGALVQTEGTFNEGLGTTTGSEPVILDRVALHYTGAGVSTIALRGISTLSGTISAGQVLSIQSTAAEHAVTTAPKSFTSSGTIDLTNGDGAGNNATLNITGEGTLTNKSTGAINSENPHGGTRTIGGAVKNEGTLSLSAGETLKVTDDYTQTGLGTLKTAIASASSFGALSAAGNAKAAGALVVTEVEAFVGKAGESFAILASAKLTGTFTDLDGVITATPGRYYRPTYSGTGVTLVDTQAAITPTPSEGAAGSKVTVTGSGWLAKDKVKVTFTDVKKGKTVFPTATVGAGGEFSVEGALSAKAAKGAGTFTATSTTVTGLVVTASFTVT